MKRIKAFISLVLALGLAWGMVTYIPKWAERHADTQPASVTVPDSADSALASLLSESLADADGVPVDLGQWKGRRLLINFWASWCAPCLEEMPQLAKLPHQEKAKNLQILGIALDRKENVAEYARLHQTGYPLLVANDKVRALLPALGNTAQGIPFSLLVDARGHILHARLGALKAGELQAWLLPPKFHSAPNGTQKL